MNSKPPNAPTESAVIVLLEETSNSLVLTQRNFNLKHHPGEICFPGGQWQEGDANFWSTALRELQEELGVDASRVQPVKQLQLEKTLNGWVIHPWLASIMTIDPLIINAEEVVKVITLPMREVRLSSNYKDITIERYGKVVTTCQFTASKDVVWGATARIMKQLVNLVL